jgi:hypothetical protein
LRLYHFTGAEFALENIARRRLKISFADEVNDLFELAPFDFERESHRYAWRRCIANHAATQGFISFAEHWSVPTMWAHYADHHKGLCYGFDVPSERAVRIDYVEELQRFDERAISEDHVNKLIVEYASKTKSIHWQYENEWRIYADLKYDEKSLKKRGEKLFFVPFSERLVLKEVIIGARSAIRSDEVAASLGDYTGVTIRTAQPSLRKYEIGEQAGNRLSH